MSARDPHQPMNPWHGGGFDLPDEPTDAELRRGVQVMKLGGALGGNTTWGIAIARRLQRLGPDETGGEAAAAAYKRVDAVVAPLVAPPNPAFSSSVERRREQLRDLGEGHGRTLPHGRLGDIVPADATDAEIRELYSAGDAEAIIAFRRQLQGLAGTSDA